MLRVTLQLFSKFYRDSFIKAVLYLGLSSAICTFDELP